MEGFESCLCEVLLKLSESGLSFTLKREQELAMRHLLNGKDVMTVLPTGFVKSLIFQLFVMMCGARSKRKGLSGLFKDELDRFYIYNCFDFISVFNSHSLGMQFFFLNYYFISVRWLLPLRINKV